MFEREPMPDPAFSELLESVRLEKCRVNDGYLNALGMRSGIKP